MVRNVGRGVKVYTIEKTTENTGTKSKQGFLPRSESICPGFFLLPTLTLIVTGIQALCKIVFVLVQ